MPKLVAETNSENACYNIAKLCWAKLHPYKSLYDHMYETGILAETFLKTSKYCALLPLFRECINTEQSESELISAISFIVALHDIGKCYPNFQKKAVAKELLEWQVEKELTIIKKNSMFHETTFENFRHEIASELVINRKLSERNVQLKTKRAIKTAYRNHHLVEEKFGEEQIEREYAVANKEKWDEVQDILFNWIEKDFSPCFDFTVKENKVSVFTTLLAAFIYRCDWIASSIFTKEDFDYYDEYKKYVEETSKQYVDTMGIQSISFVKKDTITSIFPEITNLRPLQQKAEELKNVDFDCAVIEDLTGAGKTEAGFYLAYQAMCRRTKQGIFFGLPTNATEETMNPRLQSAIDNIYLVNKMLVTHATGVSWIKESLNCEASEVKPRMGSSKETKLMFPFSTGTVDQIEKGVLKQKYATISLMELATKVVIIDEMHAYDMYMQGILSVSLSWLKEFHVPVVIMSATLPNLIKKEIHKVYSTEEFVPNEAYPLITMYENGKANCYKVDACENREYNVNLTIVEDDFAIHACEIIGKLIANGGNVCVICNSVSSAKETYEKVLESFPDVETCLFHGQTTLEEKHNNTEMLISKYGKNRDNRPKKSIVVATQIIEQSIDVDFDFIISELAPIDLLLQRFGRWHRHSDVGTIRELNNDKVPIEIIAYNNLNKHFVYRDNETILQKTKEYLEKNTILAIPTASRKMIEYVYNPEEYTKSESIRVEVKGNKASNNTIRLPDAKGALPYRKEDIVHAKRLPTRDSDGDYMVDLCILPTPMYETVKTNGANKQLSAEIKYKYTVPTKKKIAENIPEDSKFEGNYWLDDCVICTEKGYEDALEKISSLGKSPKMI